ncbi:MAG: ACP S-malonyltransferase [Desulfohalobiaceae bacterium]
MADTNTSTTPWAVLFPGQGSQEQGMGRDMAEGNKEVMQLWDRAESITGAELRDIYWDGDQEAMAETRYLQPALTVVGLGVWLCSSKGSPDYLAGHSVGEYPALAASGALGPDEVLQLVALRGRLMSEAGAEQPGKMAAALKLDQASVEEVVAEAKSRAGGELCVANYNTPQQLVISGSVDAVDAAVELIKERRGRAVPLPVSGAFHSPLMQPAAEELAGFMDKLHWSDARIPIHMNVSATPERSAESIRDLLKRQIVSPVLWSQLIKDQWDRGVRSWLEYGPKGVLTKMVPQILGKSDSWHAECIDSADKL